MENNKNTIEITNIGEDPKWLAERKENVSVLDTIERLAKNPDVDVKKIEAFLAMQERILDRQNREDFNRAMVKVQQRMEPIIKSKVNPNKGKYAPIEKIIIEAEPIYTSEGFSLMFYEGESHKENHVRVMCDIMHKNGHSKTVFVNMAVVTTGGKGTQFMTEIDAEASAFTKGRRYLICNIFNIPTIDDDGRSAGGESNGFITNEQVSELSRLVKETGMLEGAFLKSLGVNTLSELTEQGYKKALGILNARKRQR